MNEIYELTNLRIDGCQSSAQFVNPSVRQSVDAPGLIAGNGRFPFLVLDAARAQGHDVTIIAAKEEAFPELNDAAARHGSSIHWISLGQLGKCISAAAGRRA